MYACMCPCMRTYAQGLTYERARVRCHALYRRWRQGGLYPIPCTLHRRWRQGGLYPIPCTLYPAQAWRQGGLYPVPCTLHRRWRQGGGQAPRSDGLLCDSPEAPLLPHLAPDAGYARMCALICAHACIHAFMVMHACMRTYTYSRRYECERRHDGDACPAGSLLQCNGSGCL